MTKTKKKLINFLYSLPDDLPWDDIQKSLYKMYVIKSVEQGLKDVEEGRTIPADEAKRRLLEKYENRNI